MYGKVRRCCSICGTTLVTHVSNALRLEYIGMSHWGEEGDGIVDDNQNIAIVICEIDIL